MSFENQVEIEETFQIYLAIEPKIVWPGQQRIDECGLISFERMP